MLSQIKTHTPRIAILLLVFLYFYIESTNLIGFGFYRGISINLGQNLLSPDSVLLLLTGLVLSFLLPALGPIPASILTLISMLPAVLINLYAPRQLTFIPMEFSLLVILVLYAVNVLISYFMETRSSQEIMNVFSQYLPPHLVKELTRHPDRLSLNGEAKVLTIFFCDLHNFTSVSEQLNPKQLAQLLNEYFTVMTEILFKHEATIDKYIGDSIMAFWGAPNPQEDHAKCAIRAALEMDTAIRVLSAQFIKRGWPGPNMGMGINTGRVSVGNMGSKYRITYTAVGDAVNLAARLEGLTRTYHTPIIISETTMKLLDDEFVCRELDLVRVRGKHNKTRIYQPLCEKNHCDNEMNIQLELNNKALAAYYAKENDTAKNLFSELQQINKNDKYYYSMLKKLTGK